MATERQLVPTEKTDSGRYDNVLRYNNILHTKTNTSAQNTYNIVI